ncbi:pantetheine-phosphate adenylyltransferase [Salinibius halmophilus]|uniref:pantetheine-phosphate adenylyltransferase n=1 Tax=Salinibius halmophilus TaxID=1853216 RepID=UPI000E6651C6|nr:pantetheine-phosphate adenylyltransferase [Salinibius halmophilus]
MANTIIYPGTFDPFTLGHLDLTQRAAKMADRVVVAVAQEVGSKRTLFTTDERVAFAKEACQGLNNVEVLGFSGLLTAFAKQQQGNIILRGIRSGADLDYERPMAELNRKLTPGLDYIFLLPEPELSAVSSTLVREIARLGGETHTLVPNNVEQALRQRFGVS